MGKDSHDPLTQGFTLIELIVVIAVVAILIIGVMGLINPLEQFAKADDAQRQQDLNQIRVALDSYYNDTGCYPSSVPFGSSFVNPKKSQTIYMKKVPQDPKCTSNPSQCYQYLTDTSSSCPQWNVLLGALRAKYINRQQGTLCSLETLNTNTQGGCLPSFYNTDGYNFCLTSGTVDCSVIGSSGGGISVTPTPLCSITQRIYKCESPSSQLPLGTCNNVGTDSNGNGLGDYCGYTGCNGNACCSGACSN